MNDLEAENRVDCLAQPEKPEIRRVNAGEPKRKHDSKIRNLRQEKQKKFETLLVQLATPYEHRNHRLQGRLRAPQRKDDGMAVQRHGRTAGRTRSTVTAAPRPLSHTQARCRARSTQG